jgi:D-tyrosyl-tRNA(Tyr) deacylase
MKAIILRVTKAALAIPDENRNVCEIGKGIVIFVGIGKNDDDTSLENLAEKVTNIRIFDDENGKLNYSLKEQNFEILCVPNFTLCANINKGRRPSFEDAMPQADAKILFDNLILLLKARNLPVKGEFGKTMLVNANVPVRLI